MEEQYTFMKRQNADLCYLNSQIRYAFRINAAWISKGGMIGTIMCRKKSDVFYPPDKGKGEDRDFLYDFRKKYSVKCWNNPPQCYFRFIHGHNTWDEEHFKLWSIEKNAWLISEPSKEYLKRILAHFRNIKKLDS